MKNLIIFLSALLLPFQAVNAQKTSYHQEAEVLFRAGHDLYAKEKYGAAKKKFTDAVLMINNPESEISIQSSYFAAISAVKLFNNDAETLLNTFIASYPEHAYTNHAHFYLGTFYYAKRSYAKALRAFQKVDSRNLSRDELAEYHFKIGYCHFVRNDFDAASKSFFEIKNVETKYTAPANYYFAHIAYENKNWETAHQGFLKLKDDAHFGALVPFYIVHIYYMQGRYKELLEQAPPLLEKAEPAKVPEIARMIGEAYYKSNNFAEALKYLTMYAEKSNVMLSREDKYQLGYANYRKGNYKEAIAFFTEITGDADSLTQNVNYILGDCYIQTNQLQFARNAFQAAYRGEFDQKIKQSALLNYAKLSYQLSFNPYNDAVVALMTYIDTYPNADDIDEANALLVNVFFATKNYKAAIESIEKVQFKTTQLRSAYQKIAYMRGLELFNNRDYNNAIAHFNKSSQYILNPGIAAQALYWKAESFYRMNRFDSAEVIFNNFLLSQGAFLLPEYNMANYNVGYAYFKQKKYTPAITSFRKFTSAAKNDEAQFVNDAHIRIGDAYYMQKNYNQAIDFYDRAIRANAVEADYAMFQKAICYGVLAQFDAKSLTLAEMIRRFPNSAYAVDAKYEIGNTYLAVGDNENALKYFNSIISEHANSSYKVHAMLKTGLIHYNTNNNEQALQILKKVVSDYPATTASKDALVSIRDIYVNINRPEDFFVYVKNISFANVSMSEQDSITYLAVQNQYLSGDCDNAIKGFNNYIEKHPDGIFIIDAHFYLAECYHRAGRLNDALKGYNFVLSKHRTKFTESSLIKAADLNFKNKNYNEALSNFMALEQTADIKSNIITAQVGQMRSLYALKNYDKVVETAQKIVTHERIDEALVQEARLTMGRAYMKSNKTSHAQAEFLAVTRMGETEMKAEAKYYLASIQYNLGNYKDSEKIIFELINQMPSYTYWIAKGFILLADNLVAMGNNFQAKHTLQSIIDNYEGLDLVQIAFEKYNKIIEQERLLEQSKPKEDTFEINY